MGKRKSAKGRKAAAASSGKTAGQKKRTPKSQVIVRSAAKNSKQVQINGRRKGRRRQNDAILYRDLILAKQLVMQLGSIAEAIRAIETCVRQRSRVGQHSSSSRHGRSDSVSSRVSKPRGRQSTSSRKLLPTRRIEVELEVPDEISIEQIVDIVRDVSLECDDYHRAVGGSGLNLHSVEVSSTTEEDGADE